MKMTSMNQPLPAVVNHGSVSFPASVQGQGPEVFSQGLFERRLWVGGKCTFPERTVGAQRPGCREALQSPSSGVTRVPLRCARLNAVQ